MEHSPASLAADLAIFDLLDLATGLGGLQLLPENAERQLRFDLFASIIPSIHPAGVGRQITPGRWRNLLSSPPLGGDLVRQGEDPAENLFTSSLTFDGGPAIVFPGVTQSPVEIARLLNKAIFFGPGMPEEYYREMRALAYAVLRLSDRIAHRAGLPRNVIPKSLPASQVAVPSATEFAKLKQAVVFDETSLAALLGVVSPEVLRPLIVEAGSQELPADWDWTKGQGYATPILKLGAQYVVLLPSALLVALRHRVITAAVAAGVASNLSSNFRAVVTRQVALSMELMGFVRQPPQLPDTPTWADEMVWSFDVDKVAHILVVTDDLTDFQPEAIFDQWQPPWQSEVERRLLEFRDVARRIGQIRGILQLVVFQGFGRFISLGLTRQIQDPSAHTLIISEPDLAVIARREVGDRLALWKFVRALSRLQEGAVRSPMATALDYYALYGAHRQGFYFSDQARPNLVFIGGDAGAELRFRDARDFDLHGVPRWRTQTIVDVQRLYTESAIPIYMPNRLSSKELLVEGLAAPFWILPGPAVPSELEMTRFELLEAIAYWLWQVSPSIEAAIGIAAQKVRQLGVEVTLIAPEDWSRRDPEAPPGQWIEGMPADSGLLSVRFTAGTLNALSGADNRGERHLLAVLLEALATMLEQIIGTSPGWDVPAIVDRHAPLGPKKKILIYSAAANMQLTPGNLPRPRPVQEADVEILLDEVDPQAAAALHLNPGQIPPARAVEVLNWVVEALFSRLEAEIAALSPVQLLELLLAQHESLLYESARDLLLLPTRLACFGENTAYLERMETRSHENRRAAQANRFLIEFVAARPPQGETPFSLDTFDQLMAISAEIIAKGMMSDAIKYSISDVKLSILASGRLGISRNGRYIMGMEDFRRFRGRMQVEEAVLTFAHHWPAAQHVEQPAGLADLDAAVQAEFGFSMTDLVDLTSHATELNNNLKDPTVIDLDVAIEVLARAMGKERERIMRMIELLALRPRDSFLVHGREGESFPWRFSRELSYVRRPFVIRECGGRQELVWGVRHLSLWWSTMLDVISGGRLKANSKAMKNFMTSVRELESNAFNDAVANLFAQRHDLIVRKRVKKIGKHRISDHMKQDLGDIDVLVVYPTRRKIIAIEVKDLELARTPYELANEVDKLFRPDTSAVARHTRRVRWLEEHIPELCEWMGIEQGKGTWKVKGLIVLSRSHMSTYIYNAPMEAVSINDINVTTII